MFQEIRQHLDPDQQGGSYVDSARALGILAHRRFASIRIG